MFQFIIPASGVLRRAHVRFSGKRFTRDERGSVLIMFGLATFVIFTLVGAAVDYGRAIVARERLQATVDSAVLAAARVWQIEQDMDLAEEKAIAHFDAMKPQGVNARLTSLAPDTDLNSITAEASAEVKVPFLSLVLNGEPLRVSSRAQATFCVGCRSGGGSGGDNDGYSVEVAMMLDVTGSMAGSKIADLKEAAKDLVKILVWDDQSEYTSRVAIVPFSHAVNAGSVLGPVVAYNPSSNLKFNFRDGRERTWYRTSAYCVSERGGTNAYTDVTPTGNTRLPRVYYGSSSASNCQPTTAVMPLTNDKSLLNDAINGLVASGWTGGNLGTSWAWYMLSPRWWQDMPANVYPSRRPLGEVPTLSAACKRTDQVCAEPPSYEGVKKYAVLMTDGEYNMQFCNGSTNGTTGASIPDRNSGPGNSEKANCTSGLGSSNTQALALCTAMKNSGITVYTVGFGLGTSGTQVDMLRACASSDGHFSKPGKLFYNTQTGAELRNAFRHIASSISQITLRQ